MKFIGSALICTSIFVLWFVTDGVIELLQVLGCFLLFMAGLTVYVGED